MKLLHFIVVLFVSVTYISPVFAEEDSSTMLSLGGKLGMNLTTYGGEGANRGDLASTSKLGFAVGAEAGIDLHRSISLQTDMLYATKGTTNEVVGVDSGGFNMTYVELSLLASYHIPMKSRISPYVSAGVGLDVLLSHEIENDDGTTEDRTDGVTALDVGVLVGAGAALELANKDRVILEARYDWGLRGLDKTDTLDLKNRAFSIMLGYQYRGLCVFSCP